MNRKLNFWLPDALYQRVKERADRDSVNISALLRTLLREWLEGKRAVSGVQNRTKTE